jgi:ABC-2 type transport system permease protein
MIDDPHTSTRGSWLMLPVMASGIAFLALNNPDSGLIRTLALLPPTAPSVMPARMLLTDVPVAEILLAIALLIGAVLVLRIAAARVFRLAMLMYGKEPTWAEVRRWVMSP